MVYASLRTNNCMYRPMLHRGLSNESEMGLLLSLSPPLPVSRRTSPLASCERRRDCALSPEKRGNALVPVYYRMSQLYTKRDNKGVYGKWWCLAEGGRGGIGARNAPVYGLNPAAFKRHNSLLRHFFPSFFCSFTALIIVLCNADVDLSSDASY